MATTTKNMQVTAGNANASVTALVSDSMPGVPCPGPAGYVYKGLRYVPVFADPIEWNSANSYEALTIVTHEGDSYTSKMAVPVGVDILNDKFWVKTFDFNAQLEQARNEVKNLTNKVAELTSTIDDRTASNVKTFGAVGDGVTNDSQAFQDFVNAGGGYVPTGTYKLENQVTIANDCTIHGEGTITGRGFLCTNVSSDILFTGISFSNILYNAISTNGNTVKVIGCRFSRCGTASDNVPNASGAAVYASGNDTSTTLLVVGCDMELCNSHGAINIAGTSNINITGNYIHNNYYRAISVYTSDVSNTITSGAIVGNLIQDCGKPNTTGSGVACNGIFVMNGKRLVIDSNTINDSLENGIEGVAAVITNNVIDGTGVALSTHPTPSPEGIYVQTNSTALIANNKITRFVGYGIRLYSPAPISNLKIADNDIYNGTPLNNKTYSIYLNSSEVSNVSIRDKNDDLMYCTEITENVVMEVNPYRLVSNMSKAKIIHPYTSIIISADIDNGRLIARNSATLEYVQEQGNVAKMTYGAQYSNVRSTYFVSMGDIFEINTLWKGSGTMGIEENGGNMKASISAPSDWGIGRINLTLEPGYFNARYNLVEGSPLFVQSLELKRFER